MSRILGLGRLLVRMFMPLFTAELTLRAETMLMNLLTRIETNPVNSGLPMHWRSYFGSVSLLQCASPFSCAG